MRRPQTAERAVWRPQIDGPENAADCSVARPELIKCCPCIRWFGNVCGWTAWVAFYTDLSYSDAAATPFHRYNTHFRPFSQLLRTRDSPDKASERPGTASLTAYGFMHLAAAPQVPDQPASGRAPALRRSHGSPPAISRMRRREVDFDVLEQPVDARHSRGRAAPRRTEPSTAASPTMPWRRLPSREASGAAIGKHGGSANCTHARGARVGNAIR